MKHIVLFAIFLSLGFTSLQAQRSMRIQDLLLRYEQRWDTLANERIPLEQRLLYKAGFEALFVKPDSATIKTRIRKTSLPLRRSASAYADALLSELQNADLQLTYFYYQRKNSGQVDKHYRVYVHQTIRQSDATVSTTPMVFLLNGSADRIIGIEPYDDLDMDGVADPDDFCPEL
ncbi:MAG: hypothetical protein KDC44_17045, partial [Phaeodactylibacter sp.]|nr:hypothetical protein [Phaeodactylibacter sp.]